MKKPLTWENRDGAHDIRNIYNPNKYEHSLGDYVQTGYDDTQNKEKDFEVLEKKNEITENKNAKKNENTENKNAKKNENTENDNQKKTLS